MLEKLSFNYYNLFLLIKYIFIEVFLFVKMGNQVSLPDEKPKKNVLSRISHIDDISKEKVNKNQDENEKKKRNALSNLSPSLSILSKISSPRSHDETNPMYAVRLLVSKDKQVVFDSLKTLDKLLQEKGSKRRSFFLFDHFLIFI